MSETNAQLLIHVTYVAVLVHVNFGSVTFRADPEMCYYEYVHAVVLFAIADKLMARSRYSCSPWMLQFAACNLYLNNFASSCSSFWLFGHTVYYTDG
jgi:hypothetical protein